MRADSISASQTLHRCDLPSQLQHNAGAHLSHSFPSLFFIFCSLVILSGFHTSICVYS